MTLQTDDRQNYRQFQLPFPEWHLEMCMLHDHNESNHDAFFAMIECDSIENVCPCHWAHICLLEISDLKTINGKLVWTYPEERRSRALEPQQCLKESQRSSKYLHQVILSCLLIYKHLRPCIKMSYWRSANQKGALTWHAIATRARARSPQEDA